MQTRTFAVLLLGVMLAGCSSSKASTDSDRLDPAAFAVGAADLPGGGWQPVVTHTGPAMTGIPGCPQFSAATHPDVPSVAYTRVDGARAQMLRMQFAPAATADATVAAVRDSGDCLEGYSDVASFYPAPLTVVAGAGLQVSGDSSGEPIGAQVAAFEAGGYTVVLSYSESGPNAAPGAFPMDPLITLILDRADQQIPPASPLPVVYTVDGAAHGTGTDSD